MYACILETGRGLIEGVCRLVDCSLTFRNPPTWRSGAKAKQRPQRPSEPFAEEIASVRVLDPACVPGNFLSVSMQQLLNSEREVITFAVEVGLPTFFPNVEPEQGLRGRRRAPS
jgi:hypothetical protein